MARPFWKGAISFGLVSIPVNMYIGTKTRPVELHLLHKKCLTRPRQVLHCDEDNEDISIKDTVRGYEYAKGQFVVLNEADFAKLPVKTTRLIDIVAFVKADEIDPAYYENVHYLEPEKLGLKPFLLLREALERTGRVAVAKVSFQRREHLACLRPSADSILLHTLRYAGEILPRSELAPPKQEISPQELEMATSLIELMSRAFELADYRDEYLVALEGLIESKIRGKEITAPPEEPKRELPDLVAAMRASIEAAKKSSPSPSRSKVARA